MLQQQQQTQHCATRFRRQRIWLCGGVSNNKRIQMCHQYLDL